MNEGEPVTSTDDTDQDSPPWVGDAHPKTTNPRLLARGLTSGLGFAHLIDEWADVGEGLDARNTVDQRC